MFARVHREFLGTSAPSRAHRPAREGVTARGAMPRPESFGVEEMLGNGNDNVPVKGDFRVRLARARSTPTLLPLRVSRDRGTRRSEASARRTRGGGTRPAGLVLRSDCRALPSPWHHPPTREQATTDPPRPRADPTASVIRRSAEWRSGASGLGLSQDERDFLTELAAKRELVTDRARYAEYATAASTGQRPMPVARPATAPAQERGPARPATAPTRGPARFATKSAKTPPRRETHSLRTAFADPRGRARSRAGAGGRSGSRLGDQTETDQTERTERTKRR